MTPNAIMENFVSFEHEEFESDDFVVLLSLGRGAVSLREAD